MFAYKYLSIIILSLFLNACGGNDNQPKNDFKIETNAKKNAIAANTALKLSIKNPKKHTIDKVEYSLNNQPISESTDLSNHKLGAYKINATITYNGGDTQTAETEINILNSNKPKIWTYEIVNEYPHDITSYTQGLEFNNGTLYESTGQYKESKLRKIKDYKTGEVDKNINLSDEYFGEGLTVLNDKVYQLTWRKGIGFVYDKNNLEKQSSFKYGNSKEGWGLCNDSNVIYKSDGTERIWTLDPETLTEGDNIQVFTHKGKIGSLNELEWINDKIYANIYQRNGVAVINPKNGAVDAIIDFSPLKEKVTQHDKLDVLNGIAYNPDTNTIFVTGKRWDKIFEVKVVEK